MKIFDIDQNWLKVRQHLNDPTVQMTLDLGMTVYAETLLHPPGRWVDIRAPWMFSDEWDARALDLFENSNSHKEWLAWSTAQEPKNLNEVEIEKWYDSDAAEQIGKRYNELAAVFYPQPDTPDWYRCYGAGRFLGAFNCALGIRIAPHLDWQIILGRKYTTAIGYENDYPNLCFDILLGHEKTSEEILKLVHSVKWRIPLGIELLNLKCCLRRHK